MNPSPEDKRVLNELLAALDRAFDVISSGDDDKMVTAVQVAARLVTASSWDEFNRALTQEDRATLLENS